MGPPGWWDATDADGGGALIYGDPRFTRDVDLVLELDAASVRSARPV